MSNVGRSRSFWMPAVLVAAALAAPQAQAFSTGIASTQFGPLGCNGCHTGGNTPVVTLVGPTSVTQGSTNEYTVQIFTTGSQNKAGLNARGSDGTLAVGGSDSSGTKTIVGTGGLTEITHTMPKMASAGVISFSVLITHNFPLVVPM